MKIRTRLAIRFALIVGTILLLFTSSIYYFASRYRENQFRTRLYNKAITTTRLLLEVEEVDKKLLDIIERNTVNALFSEKISVYNFRNERIYHQEESGPPLNISTDMLNKIRLEKDYRFGIDGQEAVGILFEADFDRFVVIAAATDELGLTQLEYLRVILVSGLLVSVVITLISGWMFAREMLAPISNVIARVENITASNLSLRVDEGNKQDEIALLAVTFNGMLGRLEAAFEMQKRFVANSSHELRTPLTAITGQIEVTLLSRRTVEEYEQILRSILDDIRNLTRLTNGLLTMAQVSSETSDPKLRNVRIDELLWQTRDDLLKVHPDYSVNIFFENLPDDESKLTVHGNEQLLRTALINIMDNGCKYSNDRRVNVYLEAHSLIRITCIDKGIGIPAEDIAKILQPFYRSDNARSQPGHGLGLPLAHKIIQLHHGKLHISSQPGKGTAITVELPPIA